MPRRNDGQRCQVTNYIHNEKDHHTRSNNPSIKLQQQIGGNIANISGQTKQIGADINNKLMTDNGYAGSKQMNHDLGKEQLSELGDESVTGNSAMAQVAPGFATL